MLSRAAGTDGQHASPAVWQRAQKKAEEAFLKLLEVGVKHLDVAPRNVMVSEGPGEDVEVLVIDLGLCDLLDRPPTEEEKDDMRTAVRAMFKSRKMAHTTAAASVHNAL